MSQAEDLDAINEYIQTQPVVSPKAAPLKTDWANWWNGLSWYDKNVDSNVYNIARNKRNAFSLANVTTPAEHAAAQAVVQHGITTEQQQGHPDPRDAAGNFPVVKPPLIPTEYKAGVIVAGVLFGGLFFYGLSQSLPKALLSRGAGGGARSAPTTPSFLTRGRDRVEAFRRKFA